MSSWPLHTSARSRSESNEREIPGQNPDGSWEWTKFTTGSLCQRAVSCRARQFQSNTCHNRIELLPVHRLLQFLGEVPPTSFEVQPQIEQGDDGVPRFVFPREPGIRHRYPTPPAVDPAEAGMQRVRWPARRCRRWRKVSSPLITIQVVQIAADHIGCGRSEKGGILGRLAASRLLPPIDVTPTASPRPGRPGSRRSWRGAVTRRDSIRESIPVAVAAIVGVGASTWSRMP